MHNRSGAVCAAALLPQLPNTVAALLGCVPAECFLLVKKEEWKEIGL